MVFRAPRAARINQPNCRSVTERDVEWDFHPWLCEKLGRLQKAAKGLVRYWLTDPDSVVVHKESGATARDWLRQMLALYFGELKHKALTVFEEVCSDRLEIKLAEDEPPHR